MSDPAYLRRRPDGVEVAVKVTPKAGRAGIDAPLVDAAGQAWLAVKVCEPPEDGRATDAVRRLLADRCGLAAFFRDHLALERSVLRERGRGRSSQPQGQYTRHESANQKPIHT